MTLNHADVIGDQSDAVTQNAWFLCALCAAISGEISILIQTGAESWGRFPVPRICRWESKSYWTQVVFQGYRKNLIWWTHGCLLGLQRVQEYFIEFVSALKSVLNACSIDTNYRYSGHSFHRGGASYSFHCGVYLFLKKAKAIGFKCI